MYEIPDFDWAIFDCYGPCPKALQDVNTKIWKEWLPGNPDFEFPGRVNIEWYGDGYNHHCQTVVRRVRNAK